MSRALRAFCGSSAELYAEALARHRRVLRDAFVAEGGCGGRYPGGRVLHRLPDRCWAAALGEGGAAGARVGSDRGADGRFDPRAPATPYRWFRISPRRIQAWREVNELPDRELMRDGSWLV